MTAPRSPEAFHFPSHLYDKKALYVVEKLQENGFEAYFVGGCLRDFILGKTPKDFDVLTNARPEAIMKLFRQTRIIGRRFPIVHVTFGRHIIEVTSWVSTKDSWWRRLLSNKIRGSLKEDAKRRDFTANALYFDPCKNQLHDPLHGLDDLRKKLLKTIGDPNVRLREDPIRLLRALRFAGKTGLRPESVILENIPDILPLLAKESDQRLYLEWVKILLSGASLPTLELIMHAGCLDALLPAVGSAMNQHHGRALKETTLRLLQSIDQRLQQQKSVSLVFGLSALFWPAISEKIAKKACTTEPQDIADCLQNLTLPVRIPLRIREGMAELYALQFSMRRHGEKDVQLLLAHPRFRAAYDFLILRAFADHRTVPLASWWKEYMEGDDFVRAHLLREEALREARQIKKGPQRRGRR